MFGFGGFLLLTYLPTYLSTFPPRVVPCRPSLWLRVCINLHAYLSGLCYTRILHFVLFVRACVEVDRHKKDRRVQELILAMQKQGRNPRDFPLLATFTQQHHHHHQTSAFSSTLVAAAAAATKTTPSASERDFSLKYDHALGPPVPGLLASSSSSAVAAARSVTDARLPADAEFPGEMPVSPEELRNEKVLIGAFPR
ncbi:hypothetical protein F5X96DRAFT_660210 [Biscogniauxia mediterranea]|nr:hypothetical protein F5X96DRAFT_660210 [Biscogniauxia mediterranea]